MRTGRTALSWARSQVDRPAKDFHRLCLQFVRMAYGLPAVYPDAGTAWDQARHQHPTTDASTIPAAVPVFWELPSTADHVALSTGGGWCLSTDAKRRGRVDRVRIDAIGPAWGGKLLGWTEDLNGTMVWSVPTPANNVTAARDHLRDARKSVREAMARLDQAPEDRELVQLVHDQLDELVEAISGKLGKLPAR